MSEEKTATVDELTVPQTEEEAKAMLYTQLREEFGPGAPDEKTVAGWKAQCGRVRLFAMSDTEVYFYRPVKRAEYKGLIAQAQASGTSTEEFLQEQVVARCILWPKLDQGQMSDTLGGTIPTLYNLIMQSSNFIAIEEATMMVREL